MGAPYLHSLRSQHILQMTREGYAAKNIAEELNLSYQLVSATIKKARDEGVLPPRKPKSPLIHNSTHYLKRGSIKQLVSQLSDDQALWLVREADKYGCETMSEIILEIVRDAYEAREEATT